MLWLDLPWVTNPAPCPGQKPPPRSFWKGRINHGQGSDAEQDHGQRLLSISITKYQDWGFSHYTGVFERDGAWSREHSLRKQKGAHQPQDFGDWRVELLTQTLGAAQVGAWGAFLPFAGLESVNERSGVMGRL